MEIVLNGFKKVDFNKRQLNTFLLGFFNVKISDWFGDNELTFYSSNSKEIAAFDINTKEVYLKSEIKTLYRL